MADHDGCVHCFCTEGAITRTSNPPQTSVQCCKCGLTRWQSYTYVMPAGHGPYAESHMEKYGEPHD